MGPIYGKPVLPSAGLGKVRTRSTADSSARAKLSRDSGGFFIHQIGHVGTADQRTAEYHLESDGESIFAVGVELSGRYVGCHRQGPSRSVPLMCHFGHLHV